MAKPINPDARELLPLAPLAVSDRQGESPPTCQAGYRASGGFAIGRTLRFTLRNGRGDQARDQFPSLLDVRHTFVTERLVAFRLLRIHLAGLEDVSSATGHEVRASLFGIAVAVLI